MKNPKPARLFALMLSLFSQFEQVASKVHDEIGNQGAIARYAHVRELAHTSRAIKTSKRMGTHTVYLNCGFVRELHHGVPEVASQLFD